MRNHFPVAVEPARDGIHPRLDQITDNGQCSDHVSVQRAIPHRHFGFVSSCENKRAEFVGEGHQQVPANTRLNVLFCYVWCQPAEQWAESMRVLTKQSADLDKLKTDPEIGCELTAIVDRSFRRIGARHANSDHILGTQCFARNRGNQSRIYAAAQAYEHLAK